MCCSETKILTLFFLLISHVDTWFFGVGVSNCTRGPTVLLQCTCSKQKKSGEEKRVRNILSPRGLANKVEHQRSLRVESPIGRAAGRQESVRSISLRSNDLL